MTNNLKNHNLIFQVFEKFLGKSVKIYICNKCNYELYAYPEDNFTKLYYSDNKDEDPVESLLCDEMVIKRLLE